MKDDEKDLLKTFGELTQENRASLLAFAHVTHEAQENTRRAMEKENMSRKQHESDAVRKAV
jgi:hypothetical protein